MIKLSLIVLAAMLATPAFAQMAAPAAPAAGYPKCTSKMQDACDQSMTTEKNAISAAEADRRHKHAEDGLGASGAAAGGAAMAAPAADPAMPMHHKKMTKKQHAAMMKAEAEKAAADAAAMPPK